MTLRFSQNLLKETNNYELALTEKQLEGLPESSLESYAQTAKDKGKEGSIITLDAPSFVPFMKYCDDRSLRREVYMAYNTQCTHNNEYNNVDIKMCIRDRRDTITLIHQNIPYLQNIECGTMMFYKVEDIKYTTYNLKSIEIVNSDINNEEKKNFNIYYVVNATE